MLVEVDAEQRMQRKLNEPSGHDEGVVEPGILPRDIAQVLSGNSFLPPVKVSRTVALIDLGPELRRIELANASSYSSIDNHGLMFHRMVPEQADHDIKSYISSAHSATLALGRTFERLWGVEGSENELKALRLVLGELLLFGFVGQDGDPVES